MAARKLRDELLASRGRGETHTPDARLRFRAAADAWLAGPVLDLRATTQAGYRSAVEQHLRARFGNRRLDSITADELAAMVRELRRYGKSEATIHAVLGATGRIYKFAARRLGFSGANPTSLMLPSERPKVSLAKRLPIFTPEQIEQTLAASHEPYRTLFTVAALTGARISELCGLTWEDVRLDHLVDAEVTFSFQVDRHGNRRPTKTDGSARTVPIPTELAHILARHKQAARDPRPEAFLFATRTGRRSDSATWRGCSGSPKSEQRHPAASRPSRCSTRSMRAESPSQHRPARCPRCTRSGTRSLLGPCSPARASIRSHSCWDTATPRSRVWSTSGRSPTHVAVTCAAPV